MQKVAITACLLFLILGSCRGPRDAYNPYLHSKHKPSQEIKKEYVKQDRWWRRKKNIQKIYFDKKE